MADPARNEICRGQGPEDARDPGGMLIFLLAPGTWYQVLVTLSTGSTVTVLVTLSTGTVLVAFKAATTIRT